MTDLYLDTEQNTFESKMNYMNFFKSIGYVLPCPKCGMNYNKNIQENPIDNHLNSREDLIQWLINIHNETNKINIHLIAINFWNILRYLININTIKYIRCHNLR